MKYNYLKNECLVFDIETSAHFQSGKEVNIHSDFETYIMMAECKWFGAYSYKYNKYYNLEAKKDRNIIRQLLQEHKFLVGFNNEDFDYRILVNNTLLYESDKHINIDCMTILGKSNFKNKNGFAYKNRGFLMDYNFKKNSLKHMAEVMDVETQKGEIDYKIFAKSKWSEDESNEIIKYLESDVKATKQIFDKLWDYWIPFTDLLYKKDVDNLSWIKSSIASLIYKSACFSLDIKPEYSDASERKIEEMGGRVIEPRVEEKHNVWYIDFASLYPHIMCMFNLFSETFDNPEDWHGNELFKTKGYYDITEQHKLSKVVQEKLKQRLELKKIDPNNPMIYTLKIWLNGLYGILRSPIFRQIHTPNCGWDCCWLGQQIQEYTEKRMLDMGFKTIYGDTDSVMVYAEDEKNNNKEYVQECLKKIINEIQDNSPFKIDTFKIDIEDYLDYIMFPFDEQPIQDENGKNIKIKNRLVKQRKGKKKNYLYIKTKNNKKEVELVGLPIIKDNATKLGIMIYNEVLKEDIIKNNMAKFSKESIDNIIKDYLKKPDIMKIISIEYKVKPFKSYKNASQIQAQISNGYLNNSDGIINLIKNKKIGKVGKGLKYCTIEEAIENNLQIEDLDLEKLYNELNPFIKCEIEEKVNIS